VNRYDRMVLTSLLRDGREDVDDDLRELVGLEIFDRREGLSTAERARLAGDRLRFVLAHVEPPSELVADPPRLIAVHEWAGLVDGALAALLAAHYNLELGAAMAGGADSDHVRALLAEIATGAAIGVVLATELGAGDDPAGLRTYAEYDPAAAEFVLRTPGPLAQKFLPDVVVPDVATSALVMARLVVGGQERGIFPFLLRLTTTGGPAPGVWITPISQRPGWPLSSAVVSFHETRLPYEALLAGGHAHLSRDGRLSGPLLGRRERLRQSVERAQAGRLCATAGSIATTKSALSMMTSLADHRALLLWVADTFAAAFLHNGAHRSYAQAQQAGGGLDDRELRAIAVANAWAARTSARILAESREHCGTQGLLTAERIAQYLVASHVVADAAGGNEWMAGSYEPPAGSELGPAGADLTDIDFGRYLLRERERGRRHDGPDQATQAAREGARLALDALVAAVEQAEAVGAAGAAATLRRLAALCALRALQADAAWFLAAELLTPQQVCALVPEVAGLVAELTPAVADLVAAFDIPADVLRAPIAGLGQRPEPAAAA